MTGASVGFFGKLPSHGDFIERRTNSAFRELWDEWLQRCIAESQRVLGGNWLDCYLTSPMWRFFLCDGVAGATSFAGVMMPSVDRVGRYYPLTVVAELPTGLAPLTFASAAQSWFAQVEQLCADALQSHDFELAAFDAALGATSAALVDTDINSGAELFHGGASPWRFAVRSASELESTLGTALMPTALSALRPLTLWWTDGSEHVQPSALLARGLLRPESFAALLAGTWDDGTWHGDLHAAPASEPLSQDAHFMTESAGATDVGTVRTQNQDNFVLNDLNRLWAVADGMGGHSHGDVASQMVADALNSLEPTASLNASLESVRIAMDRVNADLRRAAIGVGTNGASGSTVVTLAIRGAQFAVSWAGDSRAYLCRDGVLTQITRDHTDEPLPGEGEADSLVALVRGSAEITRAVGGDDTLELDQVVDLVAAGDRFLLCSDGLYAVLNEAALLKCLQLATAREASEALIANARNVGASDNVTAVIVDVRAES
jgi:type VI secretion system ImpM family protein